MLKNALALFVFSIIVLIVFLPSYSKMQDLRFKNLEYKRQIEQLVKKNRQLLQEKKLLESDPVYLEKVAREKMGLVKDGEVIYKITTEDGNESAVSPKTVQKSIPSPAIIPPTQPPKETTSVATPAVKAPKKKTVASQSLSD